MIKRLFIALCLSPLLIAPAAAQQSKTRNPPPPVEEVKPPPPARTGLPDPKPPARNPPRDTQPAEKPEVRKPTAPKLIGQFDDWVAVELDEGGSPLCYTFTRAQTSTPTIVNRGPVVLTVTHRLSQRNVVAIDAGFAFGAGAFVTVQADMASAEFYTAQRAAFARDGAAATTALRNAARAVARSPGPRGETVTDTFSLKGFPAAYAAIGEKCPPR